LNKNYQLSDNNSDRWFDFSTYLFRQQHVSYLEKLSNRQNHVFSLNFLIFQKSITAFIADHKVVYISIKIK